MSTGGLDSEALRQLIREVLRDTLPAPAHQQPAAPQPPPPAPVQVQHDALDGRHSGSDLPVAAAGNGAGAAAAGSPAAGPAARAARVAPAQPGSPFTVHDSARQVETVSLRTDQDLAAFVTRLLHLFENPARRADLRSGRLAFRLAAPAGPGQAGPSRRIERGAVTEAVVRDAARVGARLVLGPRAVLTPLARDRARAAGVEIERER